VSPKLKLGERGVRCQRACQHPPCNCSGRVGALACVEVRIVHNLLMREVLVAVPSGGAVMRLGDGSALVVADVTASDGWPLRHGDLYRPALVPAGPRSCVVGGLLPPGAVTAEVIDDRSTGVQATVANGAYVVVLNQRNEGAEPIVCCRGSNGAPVNRPPATGHRIGSVEDADVPCPACGAIDFEEYLPVEAGSSGPIDAEGKIVPQQVVRCRVCGQQEREATVVRTPDPPDSPAPILTRDQLMAKADAMRREFMWRSIEGGVRTQGFPIYVAAGWPARVSQSGSEDDGRLTSVTVTHLRVSDANDSETRLQPELTVTTERDDPRATGALDRAQLAVRRWARDDDSFRLRPGVSNAASTLRHRARSRHDLAAALNAVQSERTIEIGGQPVPVLVLTTTTGGWAVAASHNDLAITVTGHDLGPKSVSLELAANPVTTFGPPFA
jgi:hypothetical protein